MASILLDISRTFARANLPAQTGIDRVELAYFGWAMARGALFLIRVPGRDVIASAKTVKAALNTQRKSLIGALAGMTPQQSALVSKATLRPQPSLKPGFTYLNVGHSNLKPRVLEKLRGLGMGHFMAMVHDTIPLDCPHLCRADQNAPAENKLQLIAANADAVIAVSRQTATRFSAHAVKFGKVPPITIAYPGVEPELKASPNPQPYFVSVGTIEPRKNLTLLLDVWEKFEASFNPPVLHIVGRRGWEAPAVLARLDQMKARCDHIQEHNELGDEALAGLLSGARALLFPTLEEGFGIPLYEARAIGLQTLATDLPVLRENGTALTTYLPANAVDDWYRAIKTASNATGNSPAAVPTWEEHFAAIAPALEPIALDLAS